MIEQTAHRPSGNQDKLLFVLNSLDVGGSETKIVRVANALCRSGSPVEIAYLNPPELLRSSIDSDIHVTCLRRSGKYSIGAFRRLRSLIAREPCTVIAVNLYPLLYVVPGARLLSPERPKIVALINTSYVAGILGPQMKIYAPLLRRCDRLVFGCLSEKQAWVRAFSLPAERAQYIYNGIDTDHFAPAAQLENAAALRRQHGIAPDAVVFGAVGRLAPQKAFEQAIVATARLNSQGRRCYLVVVGEGAERARLESTAKASGIANQVIFLGLLDDVRPAMAMMDALILPSISETFSNAALEAMSMARPVVLSDIGGAAEMVVPGESGIIFKTKDLDALTNALTRLFDSGDLRRRLGAAARQRVIEQFSYSAMVEGYRRLSLI